MSDYKIKVGCELGNDLKEQIDKYVHDTAFQLGLKYKLEKIELDEDDTLIMRIPTDESGDILVGYEEVQEYYNALKNNVECKNIFAMPDAISLKVIDDETLELLAESINEELSKRKNINLTFNKNGKNLGINLNGDYYNKFEEDIDSYWDIAKENYDSTIEDIARKIKSKMCEL